MIKRALLLTTFLGAFAVPSVIADSSEPMPEYCALESSELTTSQFLECRSLAKKQQEQSGATLDGRVSQGFRTGRVEVGLGGDSSTIAPTDEATGTVVEVPTSSEQAPEMAPEIVQPVMPVTQVAQEPATAATKSYDISFANSSSVIQPQSFAELDEIATEMNKYTTLSAVIEGHANRTGDWGFNKRLSVERAASVRSYLIARGVSASRLRSEGYSFDRPLPGNAPESGINRRVELRIE